MAIRLCSATTVGYKLATIQTLNLRGYAWGQVFAQGGPCVLPMEWDVWEKGGGRQPVEGREEGLGARDDRWGEGN